MWFEPAAVLVEFSSLVFQHPLPLPTCFSVSIGDGLISENVLVPGHADARPTQVPPPFPPLFLYVSLRQPFLSAHHVDGALPQSGNLRGHTHSESRPLFVTGVLN